MMPPAITSNVPTVRSISPPPPPNVKDVIVPPETVNEDPYGEGWLVKVRLSDPSEADSLMSASDYQASLS